VADPFLAPAAVLARRLLGSILVHETGDGPLVGRLTETEAYLPEGDAGSHSRSGPTARNAAMFGRGGAAYVYRIYGLHHCFNVVSGPRGSGEAVLIRAADPLQGLAAMAARRGIAALDGRAAASLCAGPARLVVAFGIGPEHDGTDLRRGPLRLRWAPPVPGHRVIVSRRIGLGRGADLALRFRLR
jgi:DNA-3-methyladenine glycosylase